MTKGKQGRGAPCPSCKQGRFNNKGGVNECRNCGAVGWSVTQAVRNVGAGRGAKCPHCEHLTLHRVGSLPNNEGSIRRCSICDYTLIDSRGI
jgi:ribosomal protein L37AE/L43A